MKASQQARRPEPQARRSLRSRPGQMGFLCIGLALCLAAMPIASALPWWWPTQGNWVETDHLWMAPPEPWENFFGSAVAIDGDTLVVGTEINLGHQRDWVHVFHREARGNWAKEATLLPSIEREGDQFGLAVAVDEDAGIIVVGNPESEEVYIFERDRGGSWAFSQRLVHREAPCQEHEGLCLFGNDVEVSGGRIAVAGNEVLLFEKQGSRWTETHRPEGAVLVALEGETLVTRVWDHADEARVFTIFELTDDQWAQTAQLDPAEPFDNTQTIPTRMDLNERGDTLVLGAPVDRRVLWLDLEQEGMPVFGAAGSAWIYEKVDGEWVQTADIPNPDPGPNEVFGASVAVSDGTAVIGARGDVHNGGFGAGGVYVYENVEGEWLLTSKLRNHDATLLPTDVGGFAGGDWFGYDVDMSRGMIAVGAPFDDNRRDGFPDPANDDGDLPPCIHRDVFWGCDNGEDSGSVYLFERLDPLP